ncbi:MAG: UDP-N-acetylglucosamine pyrophosphorylase [Deltaproteobacteria bacterium]|nr:UDP-N-acetylglucosamine pyrophosphorylase [Deltaproteobacteria bacterium]
MDPRIEQLIHKGAKIIDPNSVWISQEVSVDNISGKDTVIYPNCRISGKDTVIEQGVELGMEGPVTIENCILDKGVKLKGGFFRHSIFLSGATIGMPAHVREACLVEEGAKAAHAVGLKQTILMPYVTLGSLINLCDCLVAGGTGPDDHTEIGSSFIHFNFSPDGQKATPSLIGDVPRGVMLKEPRIFLGGQGGIVGPTRIAFGTVSSAGSILRDDILKENQLVSTQNKEFSRDFKLRSMKRIKRIIFNNVLYIANLIALKQWYINVRKTFFDIRPLGHKIISGALLILDDAKSERLNRLKRFVEHALSTTDIPDKPAPLASELLQNIDQVINALNNETHTELAHTIMLDFLKVFNPMPMVKEGLDYVDAIKSIDHTRSTKGARWLYQVVQDNIEAVYSLLPSLNLPSSNMMGMREPLDKKDKLKP